MDYTPAKTSVRVPRDAFEAELIRRYIQADARNWYSTEDIKISVREDHEGGVFGLRVWEPADDPLSLEDKGEMHGKVWLAENTHPVSEYYRVEVWHHIEGRSANHGSPPTPRWR